MQTDMKTVIAEALVKLCREKSIEKITVKELADACYISRQTFYYHFHDLMDVLEWEMEQQAALILQRVSAAKDNHEAVQTVVDMIYAEQPVLHRLINSPRRAQVEQIIIGAMRHFLNNVLARHEAEQIRFRNGMDPDIVLDFYAYGIAGVLLEYCDNKRMPAEELAAQFERMLDGVIAR